MSLAKGGLKEKQLYLKQVFTKEKQDPTYNYDKQKKKNIKKIKNR